MSEVQVESEQTGGLTSIDGIVVSDEIMSVLDLLAAAKPDDVPELLLAAGVDSLLFRQFLAETRDASEDGARILSGLEEQRNRPRQILIDDSQVVAHYANFCRLTGTPEEVIVDFGLNPNHYDVRVYDIIVDIKLVVNYYTAKRLLHALQVTVQRHEQAFGTLETDVRKRAAPQLAFEEANW